MSHTYAISEIVGTSPNSIDDAIRSGVATAAKTLRHLDWFEVGTIRGHLVDGKVAHFQVSLRIGFRYDAS
jgi:hypothetical protein